MNRLAGVRISVRGVVQGVGFRPFVYALADRYKLRGWVRNTSAGVEIEVDGAPQALQSFVDSLQREAPPLARIDECVVEEKEVDGFRSFRILRSSPQPGAFQPISPDVSLCEDCRRELHDPQDRRYRYPFINCTNCGPRFTIIKDIPYDRPNTTMAPFAMCRACAAEYDDPLDRRFHAQPVACPDCGPQIWLTIGGERTAEREAALQAARRLLREGKILAVKGLGGFHLACDATNEAAVRELRRRKLRVDKPFALMAYDLDAVAAQCEMSEDERRLLTARERPIVILERSAQSAVSPLVAPAQHTIGFMLPYTPLHELLLEPEDGFPPALVMTSGNISEEPIATQNDEAQERLAALADAFLLHDRGIETRCDDSVVRCLQGERYPLRRSRGYAPDPLPLAWDGPPVLAGGPELKNTFCLTRERYAFMSHHIGDLQNYETLQSYEQGIQHFERLFRIDPQVLAYDLHPDYLATRYILERAQRENLPAIGVQHHHAHIAACMAEHGLSAEDEVIGLAFDGTGYGEDGAIWGGEVLLASYADYTRAFHLAYFPMPGGEAAVKQPWRLALAWLLSSDLPWDADLPPVQARSKRSLRLVGQQIAGRINTPQTSSMGRLFDAAAALIGVRQDVNYEAQAAIELEACADPEEEGAYRFPLSGGGIDTRPACRAIVKDLRSGEPAGHIAARFHNGLADMAVAVSRALREERGVARVALSGGVWQNMFLLRKVISGLEREGFEVLLHRRVPANDGGIALGQVAVAAHRMAAADGQRVG